MSRTPTQAVEPCPHCGQPVPEDGADEYCCAGCRAASTLLRHLGLERYYDLRGDDGTPVRASEPDLAWVDALDATLGPRAALSSIDVDISGLRCAACVWVVERTFERHTGATAILVNPGAGKAHLIVKPEFDLRAWSRQLGALGYQLGPNRKPASSKEMRSLVLRFGVSAALAMNVMLLSLAIHVGLSEGRLYQAMRWGAWGLGAAAVIVGGTPFFVSAYRGARAGVLHFDLPISLGIALAFAGSSWSLFASTGRASYVDTVAVFISLMLLGRLLQGRIVAKNRRALLADDGLARSHVRRLTDGRVDTTEAGQIAKGERLLVVPGDLLTVDVTFDAAATISTQWLNGESRTQETIMGSTVSAGSFLVGPGALIATALTTFDGSRLPALLPPPRDAMDIPRATAFWRSIARVYVLGVLAVAAVTAAGWALAGAPLDRALEAVVAVLVVTCPCALGIAAPLAYELGAAALRRRGVFVRSPSFLDRAAEVRTLVFDKTGTLTLGTLRLVATAPLEALGVADRHVLFEMAVRSRHPKSRAIVHALEPFPYRLHAGTRVLETPGKGLELSQGGATYRLGARGWAASASGAGDVLFARDGVVLAALRTEEHVRADAAGALRRLRAKGYAVYLATGDEPERATHVARALGIPDACVFAAATPEDKEALIARLDHDDTLMVGDGVNDARAAARAHASGTPASNLPQLVARTDFFVEGRLVEGVEAALGWARRVNAVVKRDLIFATLYNVVVTGLAASGQMTPLLCAIVMPISSVAIVLFTARSLTTRLRAEEESRFLAPAALQGNP